MIKVLLPVLVCGLFFTGATHAVNREAVAADPVVAPGIKAKVVKPGTSGNTTPTPNSYTDLDCGGGRKLRLSVEGGTCSVSATNGTGVCRNANGDQLLDASCSTGCGSDPSLQASCTPLVVR